MTTFEVNFEYLQYRGTIPVLSFAYLPYWCAIVAGFTIVLLLVVL